MLLAQSPAAAAPDPLAATQRALPTLHTLIKFATLASPGAVRIGRGGRGGSGAAEHRTFALPARLDKEELQV